MAKKTDQEAQSNIVTDKERVAAYFKDNQQDILNHIEAVDYRISTGSLIFDKMTGGGFNPGVIRFVGVYESGKTSAAITLMDNFLNDKSTPFRKKGIYLKSEGRLAENVMQRTNIKFTSDVEDWNDGTCLTVMSNKFEVAFSLIEDLIVNNQENIKYFIIVDSMDALIKKADSQKSYEEAQQVAGGVVITSTFLKKLLLDIKVRGHVFLAISQVRADIRIQYSSAPMKDPWSGGNALNHAADWICEFKSVNAGDRILENPSAKFDLDKNKYIGHFAKVRFHKSVNQNTDVEFSYPIKYHVKHGNSVWQSKEALPMLLGWEHVIRKGAWYYLADFFLDDLKKSGLNVPEKFQGEDNIFKFVEENPAVLNYIRNRMALLS